MLAPGKYRGRPVAASLGMTSTGKEQIGVTFELVEPAGERIGWYGFFTEKALDRTLQSLRYCGWTGNDLTDFSGEALPAGFDQEVELDIQHEEYKDKIQVRVAWVNSGGGMAMKAALDKTAAQSFAEKMKATINALDKAAGRTTAPAKAAPAAQARPAAVRPVAQQRQAEPPSVGQPPLEVLEAQAGGADLPY